MKYDAYNTFAARYEVLRNNAIIAEIYAADYSVEVQNVESSELKMSLRGTFFEYSGEINFLTDRLRPVVIINGVEYPVGVFVITTEQTKKSGGIKTIELEGYSVLYLAQQKRIEERLTLKAGTNYIAAVIELLGKCGIDAVSAEASDYEIATTREDWDAGTPILEIINQLLSEISYVSAWVDLSGTVRIEKYVSPELSGVEHIYAAGELSIVEPEYTRDNDRFGKYNVFRVFCANPEIEDETMVAVAENNVADIPFSTANVGRVLYTEEVDNIPTKTALQDYANRLRDQSLQTTETVEFYTGIAPEHGMYDVVAIDVDDLSGIYTETEWRLPLSPSGRMVHKARRICV